MNIVALDLETFMNLTRLPPPSPTEPFRWRDGSGNLHAPSTMATRHLFFTLRMIWNHAMPEAARLPGNLYTFSSYYKPDYMKDAIRALTTELATREDMQPDWKDQLTFMLEWLAVGQTYSSRHIGQPVCRSCQKGYGSQVDGLCSRCRGCTAWALVNR